jgi:hypothetical protein
MGVFLYIFTTVIRWGGKFSDFDYNKLLDTYESATSAGIERNLFYQFSEIFSYYFVNPPTYMQTYLTLFNPILKVFGIEGIQNPMYLYSEIIYGGSGLMKGSAHPTIFADSYANLGAFGAVLGAFYIFFFYFLTRCYIQKSQFKLCSVIVIYSYTIPLIARGSVYYGFLYLVLLLTTTMIFNQFISRKMTNVKC